MNLLDPALLSPLLAQLATYGECGRLEVAHSSREWLPVLVVAGWLVSPAPEIYVVTPAFLTSALAASEADSLRRVCFAFPLYRRYLLAIITEGLVTAAQWGELREQVERWVMQDLVRLVPEIHLIMDEVEANQGRLVERSKDRITTEFARWHSQHGSFATWDASLLGRTGAPDELFTAVLSHADDFTGTRPMPSVDMRPLAFLIDFDLPQNGSGQLALPPAAPWTRARFAVHSSLRFYDYDGNACFDAARPTLMIWQDVLTQQPYYRAVLRCAITARLSGYDSSVNEIMLTAPGALEDTRVRGARGHDAALADLLPELVAAMGYWPVSRPSREQVGRILRHWIALDVIERRGDRLQLTSSYAPTLHERERARMLLRGPAKAERENFEKRLREQI